MKELESKGNMTCVRWCVFKDTEEGGRKQRERDKVCCATRGKLQSAQLISHLTHTSIFEL